MSTLHQPVVETHYKPMIVDFLRAQLHNKPAIVGLSGGIDSAVVVYALVSAIGADHVHGFIMPSAHSQAQDMQDARDMSHSLGIQVTEISIQPILDAFHTASQVFTQNKLAGMNLQARIRMTLLYGQANTLGALVVGTGNKTELMVGYFTKYGDGGVDLLPLGHLYKHQVYDLARELNVLETIIQKTPSAGLYEGQTDEAELGMSYNELDAILEAMERGDSLDQQFSAELIAQVNALRTTAQHKLELPSIAV